MLKLSTKSPMDKTKATAILLKKIDEWENMPKSDGYEYEKNFIEVMRGLQTELLQLSVGDIPKDRNEKKKYVPKLGK